MFGPPLLQGILWTPLEYLGLLMGVFLGGWFLSGDSGLQQFCWRKREITAALFIPFLPGPSFKTVKDDHDDQLSTTFKARAS